MRLMALIAIPLALGGAAALAAPNGLPKFAVPDCLGVNIHFVGREDKQVDHIAKAGFRFIRMDYIWSNVETNKGEYNFKPYDELLDSLAERNIRPLLILCYGNSLYDGGAAPHSDEARAAFVAYARAAAARYKGRGVLWEIWNEPNLGKFWSPAASPENYYKLASDVAKALKEADPDCTVLAPALAGWDLGFLEDVFNRGLLDCIDVVSLHAYGSPKPEDAERYYSDVKALIRKYGKGRQIPIVSGEWGYTAIGDTTVETQGQYIARMFLTNLMNDVRLSIWYDWRDDGPDPNEGEHHFGTVYLDFKEKPAYVAAQTLMRELDGFAFAARISADSDNDYLALFKKGDDYRLAVWTTDKPHTVQIPLDVEKVRVVSLTGEGREAKVSDGKLALELSGSVQYIEPLTRSRRWALEAAWKLSASTIEKEGVIAAWTVSDLGSERVKTARMTVTGDGLTAGEARTTSGETRLECESPYVRAGESKARVRVTVHIEGLAAPLVRTVELDTSACPTVEILPPAGKDLVIAVHRPAVSLSGPYKGTVLVGNAEGLRLEKESAEFEIGENDQMTQVRLKMTQDPAAIYSFACSVQSEAGKDLVRMPAKRYSLIETFAEGKVGEQVTKYKVELDGDPNVPAMAKLVYVQSPVGGPNEVCARLDYNFDTGWRFVRVSPRPMIKIAERPRIVKMWIRGDNRDGLARLRVVDSDGQSFQQDYGRMNYSQWRCLEAKLTKDGAGHWGGKNDGEMRYPISWDTLFLLDNAGGRQQKGSVYLGPMMVCYD